MKFKENDIRPDHLIKIGDKYFYEDARFLKKNKKKFIKFDCPACNSKKKKFFFNKNSFKYYQCLNCETIYITPRPNEKLLNRFYANSKLYKFWNKYIFPASEKAREKKIFLPRAKKIISVIKKYKVKKNAIMDIGAGFGTFCKVMNKINFFKNVYALEPNPHNAENCRKKLIKTFNTSIEKINPKLLKDIDVVTSFEVIEHICYPRKFLKKINKVLKKNTILVFTCPNGLGFETIVLQKKADTFDHEHLNYFNPYSAKLMTEKCGFKVLEVLTPGVIDVDIVYNKFKQKKFITKDKFLLKVFENEDLKLNFQNFLAKNKLSSHMWIIARKL